MKIGNKTNVCRACCRRKPVACFYIHSDRRFIHNFCKSCEMDAQRERIKANPDARRKYGATYFQQNKVRILARQKERSPELRPYWRRRNKLRTEIGGLTKAAYYKAWRAKNIHTRRASEREWAKANRKRNKAKFRRYWKKLRNTPQQIILRAHRLRLWELVKSIGKGSYAHSAELLGASSEHVKLHIERQFRSGMSWSNYGVRGWHIDHKKPCSSFDLTNQDERRRCFHYTNLQPLWWYENLQKGNRVVT